MSKRKRTSEIKFVQKSCSNIGRIFLNPKPWDILYRAIFKLTRQNGIIQEK
jgi:hypothetical protein